MHVSLCMCVFYHALYDLILFKKNVLCVCLHTADLCKALRVSSSSQ